MSCPCTELKANTNAKMPWWKKAAYLVRDMALAIRYPGRRPPDERKLVLSICDHCPQRVGRWCGTCGCLLWLKSLLKIWECPHAFWPTDKGFAKFQPALTKFDTDDRNALKGTTWEAQTRCKCRTLTFNGDHTIGKGAEHGFAFWNVLGGQLNIYTSTRKVWVKMGKTIDGGYAGVLTKGHAVILMEKQDGTQ
jgi:hypothetical protein